MTEDLSISPKYTVQDWRALDFSREEDWQKAVDIFEDRIRGRFLNMIDYIQYELFAGFAVMALDCLLIETLQQFREGVHQTPGGHSEEYFRKFLTQTAFGEHFDEKTAECFYTHIRCGILHQTEIKGSSRIRIDTPDLVRWTDDRRGLVINRKKFHRKLVEVFENYVAQLRDSASQGLREKFKNKMDAICEEAS
jgi:hypothetical protein